MKKVLWMCSGVTTALLVAASGPSAAASVAPQSSVTPQVSSPASAGALVGAAEWGVDGAGKHWSKVTVGTVATGSATETQDAGDAASASRAADPLASAAVAATGACHEEIYDYTRSGDFYWTTKQTCTGFYGAQFTSTQMWRSSWSGPRGYSSWTSSATTTGPTVGPNYWNIHCNNGQGTYDYYPVVHGYASRLGWGPKVRTSNTLRYDCGPSA